MASASRPAARPDRPGTHGTFILGAPGTYVRSEPDLVVVGSRPGAVHRLVALAVLLVGGGAGWALGERFGPPAGVPLALLGLSGLVLLLNSRRYEVQRGVVRARGRMLGLPRRRDWPLPPDAVVRIGTRWELDHDGVTQWIYYQVQVKVRGGWIALAESGRSAPVREVAQHVAAVAGITFAG